MVGNGKKARIVYGLRGLDQLKNLDIHLKGNGVIEIFKKKRQDVSLLQEDEIKYSLPHSSRAN